MKTFSQKHQAISQWGIGAIQKPNGHENQCPNFGKLHKNYTETSKEVVITKGSIAETIIFEKIIKWNKKAFNYYKGEAKVKRNLIK